MTLNQIVNRVFKPIADGHAQLQDFGYGDLSDVATKGTVKYPLMWVVFNGAPYSNKYFDYNFSLVFADVCTEDLSNTLEIQSDLISVAADVAALITETDYTDIEVSKEFQLKPFTQRFADLTSGVVMDVTIRVMKGLDKCVIPLK